MDKTQIHDTLSLAKYLLHKHSDDGALDQESAYVEGIKLVKSLKMVDEVLEYGLKRAVEYAINTERIEIISGRGVRKEEGVFIGKPKKGERCRNKGNEAELRDQFHTALGLVQYTYKGITKYLKDFTGAEAASWARTQISAAGTQARRAQAVLKAATRMKDPTQTLSKGMTKKQWELMSAEYGMKV